MYQLKTKAKVILALALAALFVAFSGFAVYQAFAWDTDTPDTEEFSVAEDAETLSPSAIVERHNAQRVAEY